MNIDPLYFESLEVIAAKKYPDYGKRISLLVDGDRDLSRNCFKSDTASIRIPSVDIDVPEGKARFATVRDILQEIYDDLKKSSKYFTQPAHVAKFTKLLSKLENTICGDQALTIVIDDPLGISDIETFNNDTSQLVSIEERKRTVEECRDLGIPYVAKIKTITISDPMESAEVIAKLVKKASKIVGFTGAGVSTESGVPAYRTPGATNNIWDRYDPTEVANYDKFRNDQEARKKYWKMYADFHPLVSIAKPNPAHKFFKEICDMGKLHTVITQNIDGLHGDAGVPAEKLIELHGTTRTVSCLTCGYRVSTKTLEPYIFAEEYDKIACDCGGIMKPDTISFGQNLKPENIKNAFKAAEETDLMIVMGSSLLVSPANRLPEKALERGIPVVLVNIGTTSFDHIVTVHATSKCGNVMQKVIDKIVPKPKLNAHFLQYYTVTRQVKW